jgi:predicted lysophospholipase L1 biosynthesis ABC-type transport system permease subunit
VPREHGAWGMLVIPPLTGGAVGHFDGGRLLPVFLLTLAVLALFWLRTPLESLLGTGSIRVQTVEERQTVCAVIVPLATIVAVGLTILFWQGNYRDLIWLGVIAGAAFGAQILLKKVGRATRMAAEAVGALALTSTAPAAYCVATGQLNTRRGYYGSSIGSSPPIKSTLYGSEFAACELGG